MRTVAAFDAMCDEGVKSAISDSEDHARRMSVMLAYDDGTPAAYVDAFTRRERVHETRNAMNHSERGSIRPGDVSARVG